MKNIFFVLCILLIGCKGTSQEKPVSKQEKIFNVTKTEEEWKKQLPPMAYYVLRKAGTENAGSSSLLHNKQKGVYHCVGCGTALFKSEHKFNSGTGWPSFDQAIEGNVAYATDYDLGYARTEEHCATCGGHLGHVFNDGPKQTTGKRHCINGAALRFSPEK